MSYFLSRPQMVSASGLPHSWPARLSITAVFTPEEFFQPSNMISPRVFCVKDMQVTIDDANGKVTTRSNNFFPSLQLKLPLSTGELIFDGSNATLTMQVFSEDDVVVALDWLGARFPMFLSTSAGIFIDVKSVTGTVADIPICGKYPPGSYSAMWVNLDAPKRYKLINRALQFPSQESLSYPRFMLSSVYYRHALRLLSPHETLFAPYYAHSEVMLNIAKCLEIAFNTGNRDKLRKRFLEMGYTNEQVETQIIPIFLVRNEADVGHPRATRIPIDDIKTYRAYIDRSLINTGAILLKMSEQIKKKDDFLEPVDIQPSGESDKLVLKLREYLKAPALCDPLDSPVIMETTSPDFKWPIK